MRTLTHIVAMSENRVIGRGGGLPWHIPEDFKFFKRVTMGHAMIMGRKTYDSIGRPLPGRLSVVVTRDPSFRAVDGVVVVGSLDDAIRHCEARPGEWGDEIFIIGGGEIFRQSLPIVDRIYLTIVHKTIDDGDTFYPAVDEREYVVETMGGGTEPVGYTMMKWERKR